MFQDNSIRQDRLCIQTRTLTKVEFFLMVLLSTRARKRNPATFLCGRRGVNS